jgi:glycosyltransferase involved in cell wall biosynthesis
MKKKVLIAHERLLSFGGGERVALVLKDIFDAPLVVACFNEENEHYKGLKNIVSLNSWNAQAKGLVGIVKNVLKTLFAFWRYKHDADLVIASGMWASHIRKNDKKAIYVHSPARELYDLKYHFLRNFKSPLVRLAFKCYCVFREFLDQKIMKEADLLICNSKNTQIRIKRYYGKRSYVVTPVSADHFKFNSVGDFWLMVGRFEDIKRPQLAIEVFKQLPSQKLVLVGNATYGDVEKLRNSIKGHKNIEIVENASEKKLIDLYANCRGTLHLAQFEDFGLTTQESFKSGKPAIVLDDGEGFVEQINEFNGVVVSEPYAENMKKVIESWNVEEWDYKKIEAYGKQFNIANFKKQLEELFKKEGLL